MNGLNAIIRGYTDSDYKTCENLVNSAWDFDGNFRPQELADIAKLLYTKGSVLGSNFKRVVEVDGKVVGFIFAFDEIVDKPKREILFGLNILRRIFLVKGMRFKEKKQLLKALNTHEVNRSKLVGRGRSEIVLFVIHENHQRIGYGKRLLSEFFNQCRKSGVKSIIVETNKLGASLFYEGVGFKHIGNFDSPLHEYATKGGQACMYEYNL